MLPKYEKKNTESRIHHKNILEIILYTSDDDDDRQKQTQEEENPKPNSNNTKFQCDFETKTLNAAHHIDRPKWLPLWCIYSTAFRVFRFYLFLSLARFVRCVSLVFLSLLFFLSLFAE